ncbi:MAG: ESPR-type extended signal peptide-containing protein [Betaproteobacteria bacterium]
MYKHASINRVYKLVWNHLRRMWVPVPEHKTACSGKKAKRSNTGKDLQGINGKLSGNFALGSDVDASPASNWNSGSGFVPISFGARLDSRASDRRRRDSSVCSRGRLG